MTHRSKNYIPTVTAAVILETRKPRGNDTYSVNLRITQNRKRRYYSLRCFMTQEDWDGMFVEKPTREGKKLKDKVDVWQKKAENIIQELSDFTFDAFEKKYFGATQDEKDVFLCYQNTIDALRSNGQVGTAVNYECAKGSFERFTEAKKINTLKFSDITPGFLTLYEDWMLKEKELSPTTVSMYVRTLRTLFNNAIDNGVVNQDLYPFRTRKGNDNAKSKYKIKAGKNIKRALTLVEIEKIFNYKAIDGSREQWGRDMWVFSYLCNGMNITDINRLKYKDIDKESIAFIRKKTENTKEEATEKIVVPLTEKISTIIDRWGTKPAMPDQYVFSFLNGYDTPQEKLDRVKDITKQINKYIKKVTAAVSIDKNVTCMTARHSFATVLKRAGVSVEMISESLGHSSITVTKNYLAGFELDAKRKNATELTNFKQPKKRNSLQTQAKKQ